MNTIPRSFSATSPFAGASLSNESRAAPKPAVGRWNHGAARLEAGKPSEMTLRMIGDICGGAMSKSGAADMVDAAMRALDAN